MQSKQKQTPTLDTLETMLRRLFNPFHPNVEVPFNEVVKVGDVDQLIKKLQPIFHQLMGSSSQDVNSSSPHHAFNQIVQVLIAQILNNGNGKCLEWLSLMIRVSSTTTHKAESIYEVAKQADSTTAIALPYDAPLPGPTLAIANPDTVAQHQATESRAFFKDDQEMVTQYFQSPFYVVNRDGIAQFSTHMVETVCRDLLQPFLKAPASLFGFDAYVNLVQLVESISSPIYTYFLITVFKQLVSKLCEFMLCAKISQSIGPDKVNKMMYNLGSISSRWEGSVYHNRAWEWDLKSRAILAMMGSNVSQTQLTGVKMLGQFCRKVQYSSHRLEDIHKYIRDNKILQQIYSADNHPQVISRGKEIYEFLCQEGILEENQIGILLNLVDKCHENVRKAVYSTIQSLGQNNLSIYHTRILGRIQELERASYFTDQTLELLETLLVIAPASQIKQNMAAIYSVTTKHYTKLRKHLREKMVRLYFELFIMGVEEGAFLAEDKTNVVIPIAANLGTNLSALMLDSFVRVIKAQAGKNIWPECKEILQQSIHALFSKHRIHKAPIESAFASMGVAIQRNNYKELLASNPLFYSKQAHYGLLKYLLECYEGENLPLSYQQLCDLMSQDVCFTKFIQYYRKEHQVEAILTMLAHPHKNSDHLANIVHLYSLISQQARQEVFGKIQQWFTDTNDIDDKVKLGQFIANHINAQGKLKQVCKSIATGSKQEMNLLSNLILLKSMVKKEDKKGFGAHLPFSYSSNAFDIVVRVTNCTDVLKPVQYELCCQNFDTLSEVIARILKHDALSITAVNFKINDKYMSISDLQLKIGQLARKSPKHQPNAPNSFFISIVVFDVYENEWFDKSQLISHGILNSEITLALTQIFTKFTSGGKMHRPESARLFEVATGTQRIQVTDSRLEHLYSHFSLNGEYLTLEEWLNFYQKSSEDNPAIVIDNLRKLGYGHLFKDESDLLQEYSQQNNFARDYIQKEGDFLYAELFAPHQNEKVNELCVQLLQILPVASRFISKDAHQIPSTENKIDGSDRNHANKLCIDLQSLVEGMDEINLDNKRQLWYILVLLVEKTRQGKPTKGDAQLLGSLLGKNMKILNHLMDQPKQQIKQIDAEVLLLASELIKQHLQSKQGQKWPKTLVQDKRLEQSFESQQGMEDPLISLPPATHTAITLTKVIKLTRKLLRDLSYQTGKANQKGEKIIKAADNLLLIYLAGNEQEKKLVVDDQLIFHPLLEVRSMFNNLYFLLCQLHPQIKTQYYSFDLKLDPTRAKGKEHRYGNCHHQFFKTFNKMLRLETNEQEALIYANVSQSILKSLRSIAWTNPTNSEEEGSVALLIPAASGPEESILQGKLTILDCIKVYQPELELVGCEEWLRRLLRVPHSNTTSSILYRISQKLCPLEFNLDALEWVMEGVRLGKNSQARRSERMGLMNLGCICYINSTIQQLFMIQPFRTAVICAQLQGEDGAGFFAQFQYMVYQLAFGERQFFVPEAFCLSYTDFENKPIDTKQQHDADQFLNSLLDRLEKTLARAHYLPPWIRSMLRSNFCGELASVITCKSCFNTKVKIEDFYVLTLEIKNNKSLIECFEKLNEPEIITDYFCDQCQRKQIIEKQASLKRLPGFLLIHLQRLVFDLESLSKVKLEHLVSYPEELDLEQFYSVDLGEEEKGKYRLKGFVVHVGTAESGHYYSLVREASKWIKFDDSRVEEWQWDSSSREKENTYLLIYERVPQKQEQDPAKQQLSIGNSELYERVKLDNRLLAKQMMFLQKAFSRYLMDTLSRVQIPQELLNSSPNQIETPFHPQHASLPEHHRVVFAKTHDVILSYLRLVAQSKGVSFYEYNPEEVQNATCYLVLLLHVCPSLMEKTTKQLLTSTEAGKINTQALRTVLSHSDRTIRQAYKLILAKVLSIMTSCSEGEIHSYFIPAPPGSQCWHIQKVLEYMLGSLYEAARNYSKMQEHFQLFALLMQMSGKASEWFEEQNLGPKLIHFVCGDETCMKDQLTSYNYQNPKKSEAFNTISRMLNTLIKIHMKKPLSKESMTRYESSLSYRAYYLTKWYAKIYQNRHWFMFANQAIAMLASRDGDLSRAVCTMVVEKLNRFSHQDEYILAYVDLMQRLITIEDEGSRTRCQIILGIPRFFVAPGDIIDNSSRYYKYWTHEFSDSDEFILPVLELLFTNRNQTNYFTLSATTSLLAGILKCGQLAEYVLGLPAPLPHNYYTDWVSTQLRNGLKGSVVLGDAMDKHQCLNEIAQLLNLVEQKLQTSASNEGGEMMDLSEGIGVRMKENVANKQYRLKGEIKTLQQFGIEGERFLCSCSLLSDEQGIRLLRYHFLIDAPVRKCSLQFNAPNYEYSFAIECREVEITIPYPPEAELSQIKGNHNIFRLAVREIDNKEDREGEQKEKQDEQAMECGDDAREQAMGRRAHQTEEAHQQVYECPFCTSISFSFSTRCPTCGEEWGEMM